MNKNVLAVVLVVLVAVGGFGVLQLGGQNGTGPTPTPTPTPESPTATPTPTPTGTTTATPTDTGTATATPTPTATPVPALDTEQIRRTVERDIVAFQDDPTTVRNEAMATDGEIPTALSAMAERHSQQMAAAGRLAHTIGSSTTADRYEQRPKLSNCRVVNNQETYVVAKETMEGFARVPRTDYSEQEFGSRLVDRLLSDNQARRTLELENADHLGIGIAASGDYVYVTVAVC
ncbi:CAP domain-containing protein [Halosegnis longus]